jgi:hypothetical protein
MTIFIQLTDPFWAPTKAHDIVERVGEFQKKSFAES